MTVLALARLSDADVRAIRERAAAGEGSVELGGAYDVSAAYVRRLCRGEQRCDAGGPVRASSGTVPAHHRPLDDSAFRAFLRELPDLVERERCAGRPVRVSRAACSEHGARLLESMGVELVGVQSWFERVPARQLVDRIDTWKRMRAAGWDLTVLVERGNTVVCFGYRKAAA